MWAAPVSCFSFLEITTGLLLSGFGGTSASERLLKSDVVGEEWRNHTVLNLSHRGFLRWFYTPSLLYLI